MGIPIEKARKVLKEYRESNYNASKALVKAGYSESMATKQSRVTINSAVKKVIEHDMAEIVNSSNPIDKLLQFVKMTPDDVSNEYLYIIKQNKDLTNKLKALQPLLATQGIKWNEENTTVNPTLNLTVSANKVDNSVKHDVQDVARNVIDAKETAQQIDENNNVAQYTLSTNDMTANNQGDDVADDTVESKVLEGTEEEGQGVEGGGVDSSLIGIKEGKSPIPKISENTALDPLAI